MTYSFQREVFRDVKARLQRRLEVSDKEFEKYRFVVVTMGRTTAIAEDDENSRVSLEQLLPRNLQGELTLRH